VEADEELPLADVLAEEPEVEEAAVARPEVAEAEAPEELVAADEKEPAEPTEVDAVELEDAAEVLTETLAIDADRPPVVPGVPEGDALQPAMKVITSPCQIRRIRQHIA
jgi:hypothetical protein